MGNDQKHSTDKKPLKGGALDTLALDGTKPQNQPNKGDCSCSKDEDDFDLNKSTDSNDRRVLQNRAKRKALSRSLSLGLIDAATIDYHSKLDSLNDLDGLKPITEDNKKTKKSLWNMFYCASLLERKEGKITARYCKNRLCLVCNSIKQAQSMNRYKSTLETWEGDSYFVTLTKPTIKKGQLKSTVDFLQKNFSKILGRLKKQYQRGQREKFEGIRKLEVTFNPITNKYHPHFHVIVKGKNNAQDLLEYWLESVKIFGATRSGQDIRICDSNVSKELFKYITKVVATTSKANTKGLIYPSAMLEVFKAIKGKQTFKHFGFKLPKVDKKEEKKLSEIEAPLAVDGETSHELYEWKQGKCDWISTDTNKHLAFLSVEYRKIVVFSLEEIQSRIVKPKFKNST